MRRGRVVAKERKRKNGLLEQRNVLGRGHVAHEIVASSTVAEKSER